MKISVLINSRNRIEPLTRCLASVFAQNHPNFEVVVLDDASDKYHLADLLTARFKTNRLRCLRVDTPLGVAESRNLLMKQATGDIFCIVDDDAMFTQTTALSHLAAAFQQRPKVGIIAIKVENYIAGKKNLNIPFSSKWLKRNPHLADTPGRVSYFLGTGHAITKKTLETCSGYRYDLVFGEEELDLSYRAIEAGFEIFYLPDVLIHHYPQPSVILKSTGDNRQELYHHVRNRFYLAYKYLPPRYIPFYVVIWLSEYGVRAAKTGAWLQFLTGIPSGLRMLKTVSRVELSKETIQYLKVNYGRLWY